MNKSSGQQINDPETPEEKRQRLNKFWRDPNFKIIMDDEMLTLRECYDKVIERSDKIFEATRKIMQEQIPQGKYILYVNSAIRGVAGHKDIKYIDRDRLEKMYSSETGNPRIDPDHFHENNMRRCLGFKKEDDRFRPINAFKDEMPADLLNCVGIVFSGSEADVTDEKNTDCVTMINKVKVLYKNSGSTPVLGICFGAQLSAHTAGAKIGWILDEEGNKIRIKGINKIFLTKVGQQSPLLAEFSNRVITVDKNHGQKIEKHYQVVQRYWQKARQEK